MIDDTRAQLLDALRASGGSAGNGKLQSALGWSETEYQEVRDALIREGLIASGRGRGGSVRLTEGDAVPVASVASRSMAAVATSGRPSPRKAGEKLTLSLIHI